MTPMRTTVALTVTTILALALPACAVWRGTAHVTVKNASTLGIQTATVRAGTDVATWHDIPRGGERDATFSIGADASYEVTIVFVSGQSIARSGVYLTPGIDTEDVITISDGGIDFSSEQQK